MSDAPLLPDGTRLFLGDGGLETTMIFERGLDLPCFASFTLLDRPEGVEALGDYYRGYIEIARRNGTGFTLDTPTWRASSDWGEQLGYSAAALAEVNRRAVGMAAEIRAAEETTGDRPGSGSGGRAVGDLLHARDRRPPAERRAARRGNRTGRRRERRFPHLLHDQLRAPQPLASMLEAPGEWKRRIGGIRANASRRSHEELDEATELDSGDPMELAGEYLDLKRALPGVRVVGWCCGTGTRHIAGICERWLADAGSDR